MWPAGLLIETFIYWLLRKRIYRKSWVWAHISCVAASLICLMGGALLFSRLSGYIADDMSPTQYARLRFWFFQIRFGIIWGFLIAGHIFFIATIVKSFSKKEVPATEDEPFTHSPDSITGESAGL
jgi:biotin transporter BioY